VARVRHDYNHGAIYFLLRSPAGATARDMLRRGLKVEAAAKRNLAGASGAPRRIDTGLLRSDISARPVIVAGLPAARIGSGVRYAAWVHDGTGIYGPRRTRIRARPGRVLRFKPKGSARFIFRVSVKGMRPNRYLADALPAARD
jgi:hypothetical protein